MVQLMHGKSGTQYVRFAETLLNRDDYRDVGKRLLLERLSDALAAMPEETDDEFYG